MKREIGIVHPTLTLVRCLLHEPNFRRGKNAKYEKWKLVKDTGDEVTTKTKFDQTWMHFGFGAKALIELFVDFRFKSLTPLTFLCIRHDI